MNSCKGCLMNGNGQWSGCKVRIKDLANCPCRICLVKVVCKEGCEPMISHHERRLNGFFLGEGVVNETDSM